MTIDGKDARDFDDAISLERLPNGNYHLGVHIADVSHYVVDDNPLDKEAQARSTSVYLPDRVLPMLPHSLSDGLCSLREGVPRLTLSAFLDYDESGRLVKTDFALSVIQSARRGIYEEVQQVLDKTAPDALRQKYEKVEPMLREMVKLSRLIRKGRENLGSLDFDFPEVKAEVDKDGLAINIRKIERLESHKIIEDFMISANEAVASHLSRLKIPTLYRIHEAPSESDLEDLKGFLLAYAIPFKKQNLSTPIGLRSLLTSLKESPLAPIVSMLTLRSLKLAAYSTKNLGHFGLALKSYCHFTSPIRRYPDLVVHRSLKRALVSHTHASKSHYEKLALTCSSQERVAEKMERESQKIKQLKFMETKLDQVFNGNIRHMTPYGAFVELDPYGVEGFLPMTNMPDDDYVFDPKAMVLRGRKGSQLSMGEALRVKTLTVDLVFQRLLLQRIYDGKS
jgi:ribonuclease R